MAVIGWVATIVFLIIVGLFIAFNIHAVELNTWPPLRTFQVPLFWVAVAPLVFGAAVGLLIGWSSAGGSRRRARDERRRADQLQRQLAAAQRAEEGRTQPSVPAALPPGLSQSGETVQLAGPGR